MNAGLQAFNALPFVHDFLKKMSTKKGVELIQKQNDTNAQFICEWANVIANTCYNPNNNMSNKFEYAFCYSPNRFRTLLGEANPLFQELTANDTKDFINFLIMNGHEQLNSVKKENRNEEVNFLQNQQEQLNDSKILQKFANDFIENNKSPFSNHFYSVSSARDNYLIIKHIFF